MSARDSGKGALVDALEASVHALAARLDSHEGKLLELARAQAALLSENEALRKRIEALEKRTR